MTDILVTVQRNNFDPFINAIQDSSIRPENRRAILEEGSRQLTSTFSKRPDLHIAHVLLSSTEGGLWMVQVKRAVGEETVEVSHDEFSGFLEAVGRVADSDEAERDLIAQGRALLLGAIDKHPDQKTFKVHFKTTPKGNYVDVE